MPRPSAMMFVMFAVFVVGVITNGVVVIIAALVGFIYWAGKQLQRQQLREMFYPEAELKSDVAYIKARYTELTDTRFMFGVHAKLRREAKSILRKWEIYDEVRKKSFDTWQDEGFIKQDVKFEAYAPRFASWCRHRGMDL